MRPAIYFSVVNSSNSWRLKINLIKKIKNYSMFTDFMHVFMPAPTDFVTQLIIFMISIVALSKTSHIVIDNSVKLARMTKLGELVIGFILLSVATSIPEFAVSFSALLSGDIGISIGNLLGSNIANLGLILGISAIIVPIAVKRTVFNRLLTILFMSSMIPLLLLTLAEVSRIVGSFLITAFCLFSIYSVKKNITAGIMGREPRSIVKKFLLPFKFYKSIAMLCIGMVGVMISSKFVVSSASAIASLMYIAESVIGATVIAIGTSLPELSVSLSAIKNEHPKIALGNLIGSCLTNLTLVLGLILIFSPFAISMHVFSTLLFFTLSTTIIVWYFFTTDRVLDRREGLFLLFIYIIFLITTFGVELTVLEILKA